MYILPALRTGNTVVIKPSPHTPLTGLMFGDLVRLEPLVITFMVIPSVAAAICGRLYNLGLVLIGELTMGMLEPLLTLSPVLKSVRPVAPFVIAAAVLILMQRGRQFLFARDH